MARIIKDIKDYHEHSKHRTDKYADAMPFLDWDNQPDPFRNYIGSRKIALPLLDKPLATPLYQTLKEPWSLDLTSIGAFLELSLGISAWKSFEDARWALRNNPSSGNLHPTEAHLIGLGGVYHYGPLEHQLELRAEVKLPELAGFWLALTSVSQRETWKYGVRAYRYCQLDLGHAMGALGYAAAALGWQVVWQDEIGTDQLAQILGFPKIKWPPHQQEEADLLLWIGPAGASAPILPLEALRGLDWQGTPSELCPDPVTWQPVEEAYALAKKPSGLPLPVAPVSLVTHPPAPVLAETIIRQRRSAQAYSAQASKMSLTAFEALIEATLPPVAGFALAEVNLILFVHQVSDLKQGVYALCRNPETLPALKSALDPRFLWEPASTHLPLYLLEPGNARQFAGQLSCKQALAANGSFALGMLAPFEDKLKEGAWAYPRAYWECGLIGQALYIAAEAQGFSGTGIGCYFDDQFHEFLGLKDQQFQSLYHFTVGAAVHDPRISSEPPYPHR
ncbi:MAG: hypothetical protein A2527_01500 [Candidatus Lambdaproteobacteria bacterium RIFOXYD2_FULL_50_16]|uniref:Nitroreductase domain-containing protein n=1 Tax=Candidatus Lambdaproteobacteria bacterium RIFOXYD2_FULL_50_16 TaxID=1817772 RepID=A0A1F6G8V4_9PROT|nr:MAG: hypothetical protein A2527_01500 [Candidatus Lambdaproteobacteria bacterium RIFOXYD2_FULL_50_16]